MAFDLMQSLGRQAQTAVASAGDRSGWPGGTSVARPVTDLSPHVDGGQGPVVSGGTRNADVSPETKSILYLAAFLVLAAIALLWMMGAVVFRGVPHL